MTIRVGFRWAAAGAGIAILLEVLVAFALFGVKGAALGVPLVIASPAPNPVAGRFREFGTPTRPSEPRAVALGGDGNIWFLESEQSGKIGRITPAGIVTEFPARVRATGNLAAGADSGLWFPESQAIGRLNTAGEVTNYAVNGFPGQVAIGPDGNVWFTSFHLGGQAYIGRMTITGETTEFPLGIHVRAFNPTAGPDGSLWFSEQGAIGRITVTGELKEFPLPRGTIADFLIAGPDGNVWFTEPDRIARITPAGKVTEFGLPGALFYVGWVTIGPDRHFWLTAGSNHIVRIDTNGAVSAYYEIPRQNSRPAGLTFGADRALWFAEAGGGADQGGAIGRFSPP